jgi:glycine/D-amino acid oxidase-like deaminating enzyme/nitrite reductase/ring-hydroxylating ferredoxin subunit
MTERVFGAGGSLWLHTAQSREFPALEGDLAVEVAVVGGGIVGLSVAQLLVEEGLDVAVIDAGRVGRGVTAGTTAKISSLHGLIYARLESSFGEEGARIYGEANEAGLRHIAATADALGIDCDLRPRPNYTYADSRDDLGKIEDEVEAAGRAGLPASYVDDVPLPFDVAGAIRFDDQAEFHPLKYLFGLAARLSEQGCRIFEHTGATGVSDGAPATIETKRGSVRADHVVVTTHFPFLDRGLFFARVHPERSYAVAGPAPGAVPEGMFLSAGQPTRSIRFHPGAGGELVLVGGEGHKVGQGGPTGRRYAVLEEFARQHFGVESFEYRWSTQDNMPLDGVPYIGALTPVSKRLYVATGFKKWGLAHAGAAAMILRDALLGRDNAWASLYDASRLGPLSSVSPFIKENLNVAFHFFADRVTRRSLAPAADLAPGDGRVLARRERQVAVSRDMEGVLRAVSARCTHLGCIVNWNDAERSWDCPCHGSRFAPDGTVLHGPATQPLQPEPPPDGPFV